MLNRTVVERFKRRESLRRAERAITRELNKLGTEYEKLMEELRDLNRVTEVYCGVALDVSEWGQGISVWPVGHDVQRRARIYKPVHTKGRKWNVVCERPRGGSWNPWSEELYWLVGTKAEALEAAKLFVAKGTPPKEGS